MALVVSDRVRETTASTGTGAITLDGAQANFVAFSAALSDGDTTFYAIVDNNNLAWETGVGTYASAGNTVARTTVLGSSNAGSLVNLQAGLKDVFVTNPATQAVYLDANDKIAGNQTFSGTVTLNADPASGLQAATKQYVDTIAAAGLHYHDPVRVEQEGNLTVTYDNGTAGVGATLTNAGTQAALVVDGVTLSVADRVLIYEQTDATQNGIYTVTDTGSVSTNWVLTRATDADSYGPSDPDSLGQGDAFFVQEGTLGAGETYVMNTEGTITFGTTDITFAQVSSAQIYTGGTGINITGNTISSDATLAEVTSNGASTTDALSLAGITVTSFAMGSAYSLPTSDGASGQFLQTNGSGGVTFATASVPTLDAVTGAGNNTANSITVGNINASDISCNAFTSTGIDDNATSTAITIDASENVGIGTDSPLSNLEVEGADNVAIRINSTGASSLCQMLLQSDQRTWQILNDGADGTGALVIKDATVGSERMRIDSSGNVGIGNSPTDAKVFIEGANNQGAPSTSINATLTLMTGTGGVGSGGELRFAALGNSKGQAAIKSYATDGGGNSQGYLDFYIRPNINDTSMTLGMRLGHQGDLTVTGNVTAYSDERLKSDIETLDGSKVYEMRGVSFTKNGGAGSGVIAQELQKVAPELVNESGEYLSVAYGNLVGYLIEAVKELKAEIDELKGAK